MKHPEYTEAVTKLQAEAAGVSDLTFIPDCVLVAICVWDSATMTLPNWQKQAHKHWKVVGSYGGYGRAFRYVARIREEDIIRSRTRLIGNPPFRSFIEYVLAIKAVRLLNAQDRLPLQLPETEGRADLQFFALEDNDRVHHSLQKRFSEFLESLNLSQDFVIHRGGYTSIKVSPADYPRLAEFNHLRTIRPQGKLSLRSPDTVSIPRF